MSTGHLSLHADGTHPGDVPFSFGREPKRLTFAVGMSVAIDIVAATLLLLASRFHSATTVAALRPDASNTASRG
jgi:hypothetical protein